MKTQTETTTQTRKLSTRPNGTTLQQHRRKQQQRQQQHTKKLIQPTRPTQRQLHSTNTASSTRLTRVQTLKSQA